MTRKTITIVIHRPKSKCACFLRQGLSITGLSTESFQETIANIGKIYAMFSRHVEQDKFQSTTPVSNFDKHTSLDISNRYFCSGRKDEDKNEIKFAPEIDPEKTLTKMSTNTMYHSEDNVVQYFERISRGNSDYR